MKIYVMAKCYPLVPLSCRWCPRTIFESTFYLGSNVLEPIGSNTLEPLHIYLMKPISISLRKRFQLAKWMGPALTTPTASRFIFFHFTSMIRWLSFIIGLSNILSPNESRHILCQELHGEHGTHEEQDIILRRNEVIRKYFLNSEIFCQPGEVTCSWTRKSGGIHKK